MEKIKYPKKCSVSGEKTQQKKCVVCVFGELGECIMEKPDAPTIRTKKEVRKEKICR
jgi:hypothetical protein